MILTICLTILLASTIFLYIMDEDHDYITTFIVSLICITVISFMEGSDYQKTLDKKSKKPVTPTLEIKCINGKCDTTYIYEFEENNDKN